MSHSETKSRLHQFKALFEHRKHLQRTYQAVFNSPDGQIVLNDLLRECGILETSTVAGDPYMTHHNDGRKAIGYGLMKKLRWSEVEMMRLALQRMSATAAMEPEEG